MEDSARAYWICGPAQGQIRAAALPARAAADVRVRTLFSGVSLGTESLVFRGRVPASQYTSMRAPFQQGNFPAPVKYGYLNVGVVQDGPRRLLGRTVFCLYPHQDVYVVPARAVLPVPDGVPPRRAVLAGMVETALNALWDAAPRLGDRIAVVGAGTLGACVARLVVQLPGVQVTLVDIDAQRAALARALGVGFALPAQAAGSRDLVFHASATSAGLQCALELLGPEASVYELSWFGDEAVQLQLGGAFHSRRLAIRASQVGQVAPARRARRSRRERLALALELLRDPAFDVLLTGVSDFESIVQRMPQLVERRLPALCHVFSYAKE